MAKRGGFPGGMGGFGGMNLGNIMKQAQKMQADLTKTQDYWPKIVEDYKTSGKMFMYMNLEGTIAREINDMTLEIGFPNGMNPVAKEFLARPDIKQNLRETIHLACGKEMQIKFVDNKEDEKTSNNNEFEQFVEKNDIPFNII